MDRLQVPPIRTPLADGNGQPSEAKTAKEWYLHWQKSGDLVNGHTDALVELDTAVEGLASELAGIAGELGSTIRHGTHAERLATPPSIAPAAALWMETDRNNVVYQTQPVAGSAAWVYVTGAMYGTIIAVDQRPTDLGANDVGFLFLSSDSASVRWDGAVWHAIGVSQTPWTSNIDAAGHQLANASAVGIGTPTPLGALEVNVFQKWAVFSSNLAGILPPNQFGVFAGWNFSGGLAEANLAFNGASGLEIADTTGNVLRPRVQISNAGIIRLFLGGSLKTLSVDASGFVKAA